MSEHIFMLDSLVSTSLFVHSLCLSAAVAVMRVFTIVWSENVVSSGASSSHMPLQFDSTKRLSSSPSGVINISHTDFVHGC